MSPQEEVEELILNVMYKLSYVFVISTIFLVLLGSTALIWTVFPIIYVCVCSCATLSISCVIAIVILYFFIEIFLNSHLI